MANGILIVDKPRDWTSQDVVSKLRGVYHERRVGHGGTLDPMATGVLPVFLGRATRAVEFFEHAEKTYLATLRLGVVTDTQDTTGNVISRHEVTVTERDLREVLTRFTGPQQQLPPMYSAIKIGGKKLYELARSGKEVERKPRDITIFDLELQNFDKNEATLRVHCSKGTYVRTLCHDIGTALGCGGCMSALRRVEAGEYSITQSIPLEEIVAHPAPESLLLPVDSLFAAYPPLEIAGAAQCRCRNGADFWVKAPDGTYRIYGENQTFLALAKVEKSKAKTIKSFF